MENKKNLYELFKSKMDALSEKEIEEIWRKVEEESEGVNSPLVEDFINSFPEAGIFFPKIMTNNNKIITRAMTYISNDIEDNPLASEIIKELSSLLDNSLCDCTGHQTCKACAESKGIDWSEIQALLDENEEL